MDAFTVRFVTMALLSALMSGQLLVVALIGRRHPRGRGLRRHAGIPYERVAMVVAVALLVVYIGDLLPLSLGLPTAVRLVGIAVAVAGILATLWANAVLGSSWYGGVAVYDDHKLVTTGPYARVRHPLYSGLAVTFVGVASLDSDLIATAALVIWWTSYGIRVISEELWLRKFLGQEYLEYRQRTGYFVPRRGRARRWSSRWVGAIGRLRRRSQRWRRSLQLPWRRGSPNGPPTPPAARLRGASTPNVVRGASNLATRHLAPRITT